MTIDEMILKLSRIETETMYLEDEIFKLKSRNPKAGKAQEYAIEAQLCIEDAVTALKAIEKLIKIKDK